MSYVDPAQYPIPMVGLVLAPMILDPDPEGDIVILGPSAPVFMLWNNDGEIERRVVIRDPSPVDPSDVVVIVPGPSSVLTKTTGINRYRDNNGNITMSYPDGVTGLTLVAFM